MHAFLNGRLRFHQIAEVIEHALEAVPAGRIHAFQTLYAADRDARAAAAQLVERAEARSA